MAPRASAAKYTVSQLRSLYQTLYARLPYSVQRQLRIEEEMMAHAGGGGGGGGGSSAGSYARLRRESGAFSSSSLSAPSAPLHRPSMSSLQSRVESFTCWPHNDASARGHPYAQPFILALEGFYQAEQQGGSGEGGAASPSSAADHVVCFACGCALFGWDRSDVPSGEHRKHCSEGRTCPLITMRAQSGCNPSDEAIQRGIITIPSLSPPSSSAAGGGGSGAGTVAAISGAMERERERERARAMLRDAQLEASLASGSSYGSLLMSRSFGGIDVLHPLAPLQSLGGASGSASASTKASLPTMAASPSPQPTSSGGVDTTDRLYLPVPAPDLHRVVYVRPQGVSVSVHTNGGGGGGGLDVPSYLDYAPPASSGGSGPGALSAFERVRARHLKRSRSVFSCDTWGEGDEAWGYEWATEAPSDSSNGQGNGGALRGPASAASDKAQARQATQAAKQAHRELKRSRPHAIAAVRAAADSALVSSSPNAMVEARMALATLQSKLAASKARLNACRAHESVVARESHSSTAAEDDDDSEAGAGGADQAATAGDETTGAISSNLLHTLLLQEITTAALLRPID